MDEIDLGADGPAALARHRFDAVIPGTRKIVARQVASEPLDHYAATNALSEAQYEAGKRLRTLLATTWPASRCTVPAHYMSDGSDLDEEDEEADEDARWEARDRAWKAVQEAERECGADWPTVRAVCEGYWLGRALLNLPALRRGLDRLADLWR